jgi:hypothetical protein
MHFKRILSAVVLVFAVVVSVFGQAYNTPGDYFDRKGEVYFKFNDPGRGLIDQLTKIISLDNSR